MNTIELQLVNSIMDKFERIARALEALVILHAPEDDTENVVLKEEG